MQAAVGDNEWCVCVCVRVCVRVCERGRRLIPMCYRWGNLFWERKWWHISLMFWDDFPPDVGLMMLRAKARLTSRAVTTHRVMDARNGEDSAAIP